MPEKNTTPPMGGQDDVLSRLYRAAFNDARCHDECRARWLGNYKYLGRKMEEGLVVHKWFVEGPQVVSTYHTNDSTSPQMGVWCAAHQEVAALWLAGEAAR